MAACVSVEPPLRAGELELLNHAVLGQDIEVAVNGAEADARQPAADLFIDLVGRRMIFGAVEDLHDCAPLLCHSELF